MNTVWLGPIGHTVLVLYYIVTLILSLYYPYPRCANTTFYFHVVAGLWVPPARAVIVLLLIVRMHTVCFGLRGPRPSCNCVICVVLIYIIVDEDRSNDSISFNSHSLVYCEAAKPNSHCLLYFKYSINWISVGRALNWLSYHYLVILIVSM